RVLTALVALIRRTVRGGDVLFRIGGDEFLLYLPGSAMDGAAGLAEKLRTAVLDAALLPDEPVSVSIGAAELQAGESLDSWSQRADAALYEAKRGGRNRVSRAGAPDIGARS
ncbi:MAG TPA: GGDEF domain-containing protein, partial [Vicinamibacterales bacterium]|nr:GGDEF domain-containing protein [Vicinamibacterales bacterium]